MSKKTVANLMLLLAALCWGASYPIQAKSVELLHPFDINAIKSLMGAVILYPVIKYWGRNLPKPTATQKRDLVIGSLICGGTVLIGGILQQLGLMTTTAGKAGFLTSMYVVMVPIMGLFLGRRVSGMGWFSVGLATVGLYLLCMTDSFSLAIGDIYIMGCAFVYAIQIMAIGHYSTKVNPMDLALGQFVVSGFASLVMCLLFSRPTIDAIMACMPYLIYLGVFSSALAFTLQVTAQKNTTPMAASLILSLESVFAVLTGAIFLHEQMSTKELIGCGVMFAAIIISQLPERKKATRFVTEEEIVNK